MEEQVYKYVPDSSWEYFFKNWTIRFTPPNELNDPYDCLPSYYDDRAPMDLGLCRDMMKTQSYIDVLRYKYRKNNNSGMTEDEFIEFSNTNFDFFFDILNLNADLRAIYLHETIKFVREQYGVLSLTDNFSSILMWSHYANCHKGFVLCLNANSIILDGTMKHVEYSSERQKISYQDIINGKDIYLKKSSIWQYEKEIRALRRFSDTNNITWIDSPKKGIARLPKNAVNAVIFGASMSDDEVIGKISNIQSQKDCAHIKFMRASLGQNEYALIIEDIRKDSTSVN